jgi:hypothetical protein
VKLAYRKGFCIWYSTHRIVKLESLVFHIDSATDPVHVILIDGEDDDILCKDVNLPKQRDSNQLNFHTHRQRRKAKTHLLGPPANLTLLIPIFRHLAEEETIEKMNLSLALFLCSFHQQGAVEVDDFIV